MKRGFTMIELVFVIVILGILASIAIPRLAASRDDARAVSVKQDIGTVAQAVPAWYQSQNVISVEYAMQFDTSLWRPVGGNMEYTYTDGKGGTATIKVVEQASDKSASDLDCNAAGALAMTDKSATVTAGNVPWLCVNLKAASSNNGVVYMLANDLRVANETKVALAGERVKWDH